MTSPRHEFVPGPSPLDCAICGQPWRTTLRGPDPVHKRSKGPRKDTTGREARATQEASAPEGLRARIEALPYLDVNTEDGGGGRMVALDAVLDLLAKVEAACPVCGGEGWTTESDPSDETGQTPMQVPCWDAEHAVILNAALAARQDATRGTR